MDSRRLLLASLMLLPYIILTVTSGRISKLCDFAERFPHEGKQCHSFSEEGLNRELTHPYSSEEQSTNGYDHTLTDSIPKLCFAPNMVYNNSGSCSATCEHPYNAGTDCVNGYFNNRTCVCEDDYYMNGTHCVKEEDCGCYLPSVGIIEEGNLFVAPNCSMLCSCSGGRLACNGSYECSVSAECEERNGSARCYCHPGYTGDGVQCTRTTIRDCQDIYDTGDQSSGVYILQPPNWSAEPFQVYCNMTDGGGWTVIQRRFDGSVDFNRVWTDYRDGFGHPDSELWLGNGKIHHLTSNMDYQLRIDLVNTNGKSYYAKYSLFRIADETDKYRLYTVGAVSGDAVDRLKWHQNKRFSTRDQDNDDWSAYHCSDGYRGGWWFGNRYHYLSNVTCRNSGDYCQFFLAESGCAVCAQSYLNGLPGSSFPGTNIFWNDLPGMQCGMVSIEMKIRPV